MTTGRFLINGATGYTGQLVARAAQAQGLHRAPARYVTRQRRLRPGPVPTVALSWGDVAIPSLVYGADFVLQFEGVPREDLEG